MICAELFADSARGIYIPQHFAESADRDKFTGIDEEQWAILEVGPDHEHYWDVWDEVLDNAETTCGAVLYQDGDLWLIRAQDAIDAINEHCESVVEYETTHEDSGGNYAEFVPDSIAYCVLQGIRKELGQKVIRGGRENIGSNAYWEKIPRYDLHPAWENLEDDSLLDILCDCFVMVPGNIFGPCGDDRPVLTSFGVHEVEIDLSGICDGVTLEFVSESCEPYISGDGLAYVTTDSAWYAVLDVESFNDMVQEVAQ